MIVTNQEILICLCSFTALQHTFYPQDPVANSPHKVQHDSCVNNMQHDATLVVPELKKEHHFSEIKKI